jgi:hypothetical protein
MIEKHFALKFSRSRNCIVIYHYREVEQRSIIYPIPFPIQRPFEVARRLVVVNPRTIVNTDQYDVAYTFENAPNDFLLDNEDPDAFDDILVNPNDPRFDYGHQRMFTADSYDQLIERIASFVTDRTVLNQRIINNLSVLRRSQINRYCFTPVEARRPFWSQVYSHLGLDEIGVDQNDNDPS